MSKDKIYINRHDTVFKTIETVDECNTPQEMMTLLKEYRLVEGPESAEYHCANKATEGWADR